MKMYKKKNPIKLKTVHNFETGLRLLKSFERVKYLKIKQEHTVMALILQT